MRGIVIVALCALIAQACAQSSWKVVDHNYAQIALSISFQTQQAGWVAGGTDTAEPLLFHTEDGATTLNRTDVQNVADGVLMSIAMYDHSHGITGALGLAGLPCGIYTNDGIMWYKINDGIDILCAVQDCKAPTPGVYIMIGEFSHPLHLNSDGIQISTDGGRSWIVEEWKEGINARYGWFKDAKIGFLSGGDWPENTESRIGQSVVQITHHLHHDGKRFIVNAESSPLVEGYRGLIAYTNDGGKSWKTMQNWTDEGVYFNEVSCIDERTCWIVGEGVNKTTGVTAAYIYGTTDGFATIQQQLYFEHGSLIAINMVSPTFGWAGGADLRESDLHLFTGHFFVWDGKTWTDKQQIGNFYAVDMSTIDKDYAYAAGLNELTLADLARFSPNN